MNLILHCIRQVIDRGNLQGYLEIAPSLVLSRYDLALLHDPLLLEHLLPHTCTVHNVIYALLSMLLILTAR